MFFFGFILGLGFNFFFLFDEGGVVWWLWFEEEVFEL